MKEGYNKREFDFSNQLSIGSIKYRCQKLNYQQPSEFYLEL